MGGPLVHTPPAHVAVSLAVADTPGLGALPDGAGAALGAARVGPPELAEHAARAATAHAERTAGRAVLFSGAAALTGTMPAGAMLAVSAIGRITGLGGGGSPDPEVQIDTRDFVRPEWRDGALTLVAMPAPGGRIAPFEVPNPTPCNCDAV